MAYIYPSLDNILNSKEATPGEKAVAKRLCEELSKDTIIWFEPSIPPRDTEPDFLVLDPTKGILVIEVKDWTLDRIQDANYDKVNLLQKGKPKGKTHPIKQCKNHAYAVNNRLENFSLLLNPTGHKYEKKFVFSYGVCVVMYGMERAELNNSEVGRFFQSESIFCKDEFFDLPDSQSLSDRLWNLLKFSLKVDELTSEQISKFINELGLISPKPILKSKKEVKNIDLDSNPPAYSEKLEHNKHNTASNEKSISEISNDFDPNLENNSVEILTEKQIIENYKSKQQVPTQNAGNTSSQKVYPIPNQEPNSMNLPFDNPLDGRYLVKEVLGEGGFGVTYLAEDIKMHGNNLCVVKMLKNLTSKDMEKRKEYFEQEAKVLGKLGEYDRIPRLLAHIVEDPNFFIVQEYIEGHTLGEEISQQAPLSEKRVNSILQEMLEILTFVHGEKIIHRDLKPENIIIRKNDNKPVLIDFGIVKEITSQGQVSPTIPIGSLGYVAPEQEKGKPTFASDIYSLGIIATHALTSLSSQEIKDDKEFNWIEKSNVSDPLARILCRMICEDEQQRYRSAESVLEALEKTRIIKHSKHLIPNPPDGSNGKVPILAKWLVGGAIAASFMSGLFLLSPALTSSKTIEVDESFEDSLAEENICQVSMDNLLGNILCKQYAFKAKSGQQAIIKMNSEQFDPYLVLQAPNGQKLKVSGDIDPQNWNSEIIVTLPSDGEYKVLAKTSAIGESGDYSLTINVK